MFILNQVKKKKSENWGGARPGAGRPKTGLSNAHHIRVAIPFQYMEILIQLAKKEDVSFSEIVRRAIASFLVGK